MLGRIANEGGFIRLFLLGRLESASITSLRDGFVAVAEHGTGDVVLDFSEVTYVDGSGIGAISLLFKRLASAGRRLTIVGASGQPQLFLGSLGIAGLLGADVLPVALAGQAAASRPWMRGLAGGVAG